jgi:hypothetical protein
VLGINAKDARRGKNLIDAHHALGDQHGDRYGGGAIVVAGQRDGEERPRGVFLDHLNGPHPRNVVTQRVPSEHVNAGPIDRHSLQDGAR